MTREEEITQQAHKYILSDAVKIGNEYLAFGDFINGAKWADKHPKPNLVDIDKAVEWLALNAQLYGGFNPGSLENMVTKFTQAMKEK